MKSQINSPITDLWTTITVYGQKVTVPCGRLWSVNIRRVGSTVHVVSYKSNEEYSRTIVQLPNGM